MFESVRLHNLFASNGLFTTSECLGHRTLL